MVKAGILGGGQLGRMLLQQAANYPVETFVMESDPACPAAHLCDHFETGNIQDFEDVYRFGKMVDLLTIEIEAVNIEALEKLQEEGLLIFPHPRVLRTIKNKSLQKQFYKEHAIPTSEFHILEPGADLFKHEAFLPFVQKLAEGGYDGKGVQIMRQAGDFAGAFAAPTLIEKMVRVKKEIAVIVGVDQQLNTAVFPPVEMVFDPELNLLDYQICPAILDKKAAEKSKEVALNVAKSFRSPGIFAIELFLDQDDNILVNETAPRVHNSGHHSIEGNYCSQYDMLWRIMLGYEPGNTEIIEGSALVNLIGEKGFSGPTAYLGLEELLAMDKTYLHLYGKRQTKPGRKMGHVTILGSDHEELLEKANIVKKTLRVVSSEAVNQD